MQKHNKSAIIISVSILISGWLIANEIQKVFNQVYTTTQSIETGLSKVESALNSLEGRENSTFSWGETVKYLNISDKELQRFIEQTDIPYIKVNDRYIFHKASLDAWVLHKANQYHIRTNGNTNTPTSKN